MDFVLWKPLYYTSIGLFILSLVLFPFNQTWSIVAILFLVSLWSRIPGFVHFVFNKLAMNDLFTLVVAANLGGFTGAIFGALTFGVSRIFGPNEWTPYTIRATISLFVAALATPIIISATGGVNTIALYWFQGVLYTTYYIQVLLMWRDEIGLEIALVPVAAFFDFIVTGYIAGLFGETLSNMLTQGLTSGWPFIIFSGIILLYIVLSRNGKALGGMIESLWKKVTFNRKGGKSDFGRVEDEVMR